MNEHGAGRPASRGLFIQNNPEGIYDLDVFHDVFIECADVTEYKAAIKLVGSWPEWERIKSNYIEFVVLISEWIDEVEIKLKSESIEKIIEVRDSNDKASFQAAKFLATAEYRKRVGSGAPSKAEKEGELKQVARAAAETKKEEDRILETLKVLDGGQK